MAPRKQEGSPFPQSLLSGCPQDPFPRAGMHIQILQRPRLHSDSDFWDRARKSEESRLPGGPCLSQAVCHFPWKARAPVFA